MSRYTILAVLALAVVPQSQMIAQNPFAPGPRGPSFQVDSSKATVKRVRLRGPTLVLLLLDPSFPSPDSAVRAARRTATNAGFAFVVHDFGLVDLVDSGGVHYQPPSSIHRGYILIRPGRRAQLIPRLLSLPELEAAIADYRRGITRAYVLPIPG